MLLPQWCSALSMLPLQCCSSLSSCAIIQNSLINQSPALDLAQAQALAQFGSSP
jgi:hypothetical protein